MTPMECDATLTHSGLIYVMSLTIWRKWETELPPIIIANRNVYKFLDVDMK